MIGVVVATHGELANGLIDALNLIMGDYSHLKTVSLKHGRDIADYGDELANKIEDVDTGKGVLVLTDIFGASPNNQAATKKIELSDVNYRIISGVNLPMLLEATGLSLTEDSVEDIWLQVLNAGTESIKEFETEFNKTGTDGR